MRQTELQKQLYALADPAYAAFEAKLAPTVAPEACMGVRVPVLRDFAKGFAKTEAMKEFIHALPHQYYDENLLHAILLEKWKDYDECLILVNEFLPYVDNWAACDTLRPKVFAKHKKELMPHIRKWIKSKETYTCRFGLDMLMTHYLDDDFLPEYLDYAAAVKSDEYYVNMMVAWYFATALAKQWDATIAYIEKRRLSVWTHNKAIQKAIESYRITNEQKEYLRDLKI